MNERNIEILKDQLMSLGLPAEIKFELRANICLQQNKFHVSHRLIKEMNVMNSVFYFEKKENEYCCSYFECYLQKQIILPQNELDERMSKIDWKILKQYEAIEDIVLDLDRMSDPQLAMLLKIKHWSGTPLASLIHNGVVLKNQFEVSQRFYFFPGEEQISLEQAYRFLSHRWREKQFALKKKQHSASIAPHTSGQPAQMKNKKSKSKLT